MWMGGKNEGGGEMGFIQHCCQLAQLQGQRGLLWLQIPLAQANQTSGGRWSPPPTWGTASGWNKVPWECGQSPESEHSTGGCPCLSLPFAAGEHQAVVSLSLGCLVSPACPLFPPSPGGHWRSVLAAAGPGQCGQMSSVSVGGELSVGITADGCSSMRLSAHILVPAGTGWGLWSPAWPGGPSTVVSNTVGCAPLTDDSPRALSWLLWAG